MPSPETQVRVPVGQLMRLGLGGNHCCMAAASSTPQLMLARPLQAAPRLWYCTHHQPWMVPPYKACPAHYAVQAGVQHIQPHPARHAVHAVQPWRIPRRRSLIKLTLRITLCTLSMLCSRGGSQGGAARPAAGRRDAAGGGAARRILRRGRPPERPLLPPGATPRPTVDIHPCCSMGCLHESLA